MEVIKGLPLKADDRGITTLLTGNSASTFDHNLCEYEQPALKSAENCSLKECIDWCKLVTTCTVSYSDGDMSIHVVKWKRCKTNHLD
jgi:hypothetical protein